MITTAVLVEFSSTEWIDQWVSKENKKTKKWHPTGNHWVNDGNVSALFVYQLVRAEREVGASIFGYTYLVPSTVLGTSLGTPHKCSIVISKQKHSLSQVLLSAIIKLSETQFYLSILKLYKLARMD